MIPASANPIEELTLKIELLCKMAASGQLNKPVNEWKEPDIAMPDMNQLLDSVQFGTTIHKMMLAGSNGVINTASKKAQHLLNNITTQTRCIPQPFETYCVESVQRQNSIILTDTPHEPRKFYFTADFLKNTSEYLHFLLNSPIVGSSIER